MENWCEYVSQDGEVRNVLQFFCECEDLDETFTQLVSPSAPASATTTAASTSARLLAVAQDRARVPWPGGARRLDLAWMLAAALLWLMRVAARRSTSLLQALAVMATCFGGLGYAHLRALRRRSDSQFHVAWATLSVLYLYSRYLEGVAVTLSRTDDLIAHVMLLALVSCYGHCCLVDPGHDRGEAILDDVDPKASPIGKQEGQGVVGTGVGYGGDGAGGGGGGGDGGGGTRPPVFLEERERRHALLLRSGRCGICRRTFRLRDHHCVWVGQCVAERNRRSFLAFLVVLAGLSAWFARTTAVLVLSAAGAGAGGSAAGFDCEQAMWSCVAGLMRLNRGGEDVAMALYASTAALLAAALAAQQIILVSAGLTSLELRRRGRKPPPPPQTARPNQGSAASSYADPSQSSRGHRYPWASGPKRFPPPQAAAAEAEAAAEAGGQSQQRVAPDLLAPALSGQGFAGNWRAFLSGTELRLPPRRRPGEGAGASGGVGSPSAAAAAAAARESGLEDVRGSSHDRKKENLKSR